MTDAYIYDQVRTPRGRGRRDGSLHEVPPIELITQMLVALRDRNHLDTAVIDDVVLGIVAPVAEQGGNIARIAALNAGYCETVTGKQLNRYCASGLDAVNTAAAQVMSGQARMTIGGGVESMSRVPMGSDGGPMASDPQVAFKTYFAPQGIGADLIATKFGFTRDDVDDYAVESHRRAHHAWSHGYFDLSVVPVRDRLGGILLARDEHLRPETDRAALAKLKPSFTEIGIRAGFDSIAIQRHPDVERIEHIHHAGNSSGIVDGASAVLIGSKQAGEMLGLRPRARVVSFATVGTDPTAMLLGPSFAAEKALRHASMDLRDIDLHELNEAFASVVLRYMQALEVPHERINVNGGAIAMGHPLGATGALILGIVLDELERRDLTTALVSLCAGAGIGIATIIERV